MHRWRPSDRAWDTGNFASGTGQRISAAIARTHAHMGRVEPALRRLASVLPAIERAPAWAENYVRIACDAGRDAVAHRAHGLRSRSSSATCARR